MPRFPTPREAFHILQEAFHILQEAFHILQEAFHIIMPGTFQVKVRTWSSIFSPPQTTPARRSLKSRQCQSPCEPLLVFKSSPT